MKIKIIGSILVAAFFLVSFTANVTEKETRELANFSEIGLSISADLYLVQGAPQKVVLEGNKDDLAKIKTKVSGSSLEISKKKGSGNLGKVRIYITVPKIDEVAVAGSANVYAESTIKNNKLNLAIAGSGDMFFKKLEVNDLDIEIAGSGDIKLAGKTTETATISIAGSGDVNVENLTINKLNVEIAGSGDVICTVTKRLKAELVGSGSVSYSGTPVIDVESIGSGKVKSRD